MIARHVQTLEWRHNKSDYVSNHRRLDCLLNRLFRCKSKKTSKLRVTGLWEGNSPVTGEFPSQRASNTENVSIWLRHHDSVWIHNKEQYCWAAYMHHGLPNTAIDGFIKSFVYYHILTMYAHRYLSIYWTRHNGTQLHHVARRLYFMLRL